MAYQVNFKLKVFKTLIETDEPYYSKIKKDIHSSANNTRLHGRKNLKSRSGYRIGVGDCRIICEIFDKTLQVGVVKTGNRRDVYD